jgi:hypothetical protein
MKGLLLNGFSLWDQNIDWPVKLKLYTVMAAKLILARQSSVIELHSDNFLIHQNQIDRAIIVLFMLKIYLNR